MKNPFVAIKNDFVDIFTSFKNASKHQKRRQIRNIFLVILGSIILAFGTSIFLINDDIPAGGLSGIGVVISYSFPNFDIELFVLIATWSLFLIGWMFLGTKFILKTLIASIVFPITLFLFGKIPAIQELAQMISAKAYSVEQIVNVVDGVNITEIRTIYDNTQILLNGFFGGAFVGAGVALTFVGGGSTGGVDILYFIIQKYTKIKESITSFVIDFVVILSGIIVIAVSKTHDETEIIRPLIGIISCLITALLIEVIYIKHNSAYMMEVISDKWEEISRYVQDEMGRGATVIPIKGGYQLEERIMLRVVFDRDEYQIIKFKVAEIDPKAFVTYTQTEAAYGEGFKDMNTSIKTRIARNKRKKKEKSEDENGQSV